MVNRREALSLHLLQTMATRSNRVTELQQQVGVKNAQSVYAKLRIKAGRLIEWVDALKAAHMGIKGTRSNDTIAQYDNQNNTLAGALGADGGADNGTRFYPVQRIQFLYELNEGADLDICAPGNTGVNHNRFIAKIVDMGRHHEFQSIPFVFNLTIIFLQGQCVMIQKNTIIILLCLTQ